MRRFFTAVTLLLMASTIHAEKPTAPESLQGITRLDADATVELILNTPTLVIIDARKREEYDKGHIEGAISLLDTSMTQEKLAGVVPDRHTPLLFYCNGARCLRSSNAATQAREWGYRNIYWFRGGWVEWRESGYPVAR